MEEKTTNINLIEKNLINKAKEIAEQKTNLGGLKNLLVSVSMANTKSFISTEGLLTEDGSAIIIDNLVKKIYEDQLSKAKYEEYQKLVETFLEKVLPDHFQNLPFD